MAVDSVTSSGREPSMSLMEGSAPAFRRSSTMSKNSHADARKKEEGELLGGPVVKQRNERETHKFWEVSWKEAILIIMLAAWWHWHPLGTDIRGLQGMNHINSGHHLTLKSHDPSLSHFRCVWTIANYMSLFLAYQKWLIQKSYLSMTYPWYLFDIGQNCYSCFRWTKLQDN